MIDLKNGKTINGTLKQIDRFMNLQIDNAVITSKEGDKFEKAPEFFIRGNSIKYIRLVRDITSDILIAEKCLETSSEHETKEVKVN